MKFKTFAKGKYEIIAPVRETGEGELHCDIEEELKKLSKGNANNQKAVVNALITIKKLAEEGTAFTSSKFCGADTDSGLKKIRCGRLRIYCFVNDDQIVLLTEAMIKKTNETDKKVVKKSQKILRDYEAALKQGNVEILEVEDSQ